MPFVGKSDSTVSTSVSGSAVMSSASRVNDDIIFAWGTDSDIASINSSAIIAADGEVTGVIIGTSVHPATAANSFILSNVTASGDILGLYNIGGNSKSWLFVDGSAGTVDLMTEGVSRIFLGSAGLVAIGDTSNANMSRGLTINQGPADDEILAFKSSDINHLRTSITETDTYAFMSKWEPTGGLRAVALSHSGYTALAPTVSIDAHSIINADTTKTTAANGIIQLRTYQHDGGNAQVDVVSNGNLFVIKTTATSSLARFIFDTEGSAHADVEWVAFADYDDLSLITNMEETLLAGESPDQTGRRHMLEATGIIGKDSWHMEKGKPRAMINMSKLAMLHHGALIQTAARIEQLESRLLQLEAPLV